jgi:hypothetical protein
VTSPRNVLALWDADRNGTSAELSWQDAPDGAILARTVPDLFPGRAAADGRGDVATAWIPLASSDGSRLEFRLRTAATGVWQQPVVLARSGTLNDGLDLLGVRGGPAGQVAVIWRRLTCLPPDNCNPTYLRVRNAKGKWGPREHVPVLGSGRLVDWVFDASGKLVVLVRRAGVSISVETLVRAASGRWSRPQILDRHLLGGVGQGRLALTNTGRIVAAWDATADDEFHTSLVRAATTKPGSSRFGAVVTLASETPTVYVVSPVLSAGGSTAVVAWIQSGLQQIYSSVHARRLRADGTWEPAQTLSGMWTGPPTLAVDAHGNAFAAWIGTNNYDGSTMIFAAALPSSSGVWEQSRVFSVDGFGNGFGLAALGDGRALLMFSTNQGVEAAIYTP